MKTKLKVGDSFEVVRPLTSGLYHDAFETNRTTLLNPYKGDVICNSDFYRYNYHRDKYGMFDSKNSLYLPNSDFKRIGKLTITKVK